MTRNVAIIGGAPSFEGAPLDDPDWEIWAIGILYSRLPAHKVDRWFEIHSREVIEARTEELYPGMQDWLFGDDMRKPVMIFPNSDLDNVRNTEVYPRQKIEKRFGDKWWSSTVAWMIALALEEYDGKIGLFGVEMCGDEEYGDQQAALNHFMDVALLTGRELVISAGANILHPVKVYPDDEQTAGMQHCLREVERLTNEKALIDTQIKALQSRSSHVEGALAVYDHLTRNNWA